MRYIFILFFCGFITFSHSQWALVNSTTTNRVTDIDFLGNNTAFISTINFGISNGELFVSTNGGLNWVQNFTSPVPLNNVLTTVNNEVFVLGSDRIWKSSNSGGSYNQITFSGYELYDITFQNEASVYLCGYSPSAGYSRMIRSSNRGNSWNFYFHFLDPGRLYDIMFPTIDTGYSCGENGIFKKVIEGVTNWETSNIATTNDLYSLYFFNGKTGFVVGENGFLKRTTNGGTIWVSINIGVTNTLHSIQFYNGRTGFITGANGFIAKSNDSGLSWITQITNVSQTLLGLDFVNKDTVFAVGDGGVILKTYSGGDPLGINYVSEINPSEYHLNQNFPNPFNPVTTINFKIPKISYVKLIIYDAVGKEIEVLENKILRTGEYSAKWDASSYPSGVYFYKLIGEDFTDTKKMVLIK